MSLPRRTRRTRRLNRTGFVLSALSVLGVLGGETAVSVAAAVRAGALAQRGGTQPQVPPTPRAAAPIDLTGNWVSVVTEDWRWRMLMPRKGDYSSVPLSAEGRKVADTWQPANLASDGCKAYGAAAIMRVPGRLHIAWENDATLRIDTDAGQQTRLLHFDKSPGPPPGSWPW